jgi:hypothetical protein
MGRLRGTPGFRRDRGETPSHVAYAVAGGIPHNCSRRGRLPGRTPWNAPAIASAAGRSRAVPASEPPLAQPCLIPTGAPGQQQRPRQQGDLPRFGEVAGHRGHHAVPGYKQDVAGRPVTDERERVADASAPEPVVDDDAVPVPCRAMSGCHPAALGSRAADTRSRRHRSRSGGGYGPRGAAATGLHQRGNGCSPAPNHRGVRTSQNRGPNLFGANQPAAFGRTAGCRARSSARARQLTW